MSMEFEPELMQDFLTETGELIEQLDADLVKLEDVVDAAAACDLLNGVFRALHTVKGAAGFLGLTTVTAFAHVAEDALNRLRKGEVSLSPSIMDSLLKCVDVLRLMVDGIASTGQAEPCPEALLDSLRSIGSAAAAATKTAKETKPAVVVATPKPVAAVVTETPAPSVELTTTRTLKLPEQKQDLVQYMIDDLREVGTLIDQALEKSWASTTRRDASGDLLEIAEGLVRTIAFFEIDDFSPSVVAFQKGAARLADASDAEVEELVIRLAAVNRLVAKQADALTQGQVLTWPPDDFCRAIESARIGSVAPRTTDRRPMAAISMR